MPVIAILLPNLDGGGVERVRLLLAKEFAENGYHVVFLLMRHKGVLIEEAQKHYSIIDLKAPRLRDAIAPLRRYLREEKPDILLASVWPLSAVALLASINRPDTHVIVSEHTDLMATETLSRWHRLLIRWAGRLLYARADAVVAISHGTKQSIARACGYDVEKIHVIHNPIRFPSPEMKMQAQSEILQWWQLGHKLIIVGRLTREKGHHDLLDALQILLTKRDVRLLVVGDGDQRMALEQQAEALGLQQHVRFIGFQPNPFVYLLHAELFVLASYYEGLGNVLTEAMACGVPVVSTDCPSGPREILENGRYGILCNVGDAQALADSIVQGLSNPIDSDMLKAHAATFSPAIAAKKYMQLMLARDAERQAA